MVINKTYQAEEDKPCRTLYRLNVFKHTNVRIACRSNKTTAQLTKPPNDHKIPPHNKWGIYQLTCISCNLSYVGQTSRSLKVRYKEHIRHNNPKSAYAQHILHNHHEYGTMNNVMTLLKPLNNPNMLISYEQFHFQALHQKGKLIPEQYAGDPNPLFQLSIHPPPPYHLTRPVVQHPSSWTHTLLSCT